MANANALTGYYASRPGIKIDGQIQTSLSDLQLQSLLVEEGVLGLFRCEADFVNWGPKDNSVGFLFFDRKLIDFGKPLAIEFGPPGGTSPVFAGRITGIEAAYPPYRAPEMIILAEDRFQDLRRWNLNGDPKYLSKTAIDFDRDVNGKPINLVERVVITRVADKKHNWLPIGVAATMLYPGFYQNPGW